MSVQYTMVPFLWRRHLALLRVVLAVCCAVLYAVSRTPWSVPAILACGAYSVYAALILFREPIESAVYPVPLLFLDLGLFMASAIHPRPEGAWLSMLCYLFLLCLSSLLYTWRNVAAVVALVLLFFALVEPHSALELWSTVVVAGIVAILLSMQRQRFQDRLVAALKRTVMSRFEAEAARESERQRIGADFHDGPLQSFISFQMRLEIIRKLMKKDSEAAMAELAQLQDLGKSQVTELRAFIRNMQPVEVDEAGLAASIREVANTFQRDYGIQVNLEAGGLLDPDNPELSTEILQIVREVLNNVRKHSKASQVTLRLETTERTIEIAAEDDGSGFPFAGTFTLEELEAARLGPKSIKRRIRTLGGNLTLESKPMQGAGLHIQIPA
jgi:signal transduction histidine kinase